MFDVNFLSMQCGLGKLGRLWTAPVVKPAPSPGTSRHFPRTFIKMSAPQFLLLFIAMNSFRALFFVSAGVIFFGCYCSSGILMKKTLSFSASGFNVPGFSSNQRVPNSCSTLTGGTCVFPFIYNGVTHFQVAHSYAIFLCPLDVEISMII